MYSPVLARFLSADTMVPSPGNPQSLNRYAYTQNNPLKYTDPSGHFLVPLIAIGLIAAGTAAAIIEANQVSNYAQEHNMGFWDAFASKDLTLDQQAMARGAVDTFFTVETFGMAAAMGSGPAIQQAGIWLNDPKIFGAGLWAEKAIPALMGAAPSASKAADWETQQLQSLADKATQTVDSMGQGAYSPKQLRAIAKDPGLEPAFRGTTIDKEFKTLIGNDPELSHLQTARPFQKMPDVINLQTGQWWDLTTPSQWQSHLRKYTPIYGPNGTLIPHN
jgi:hypothetical protein